MNVVPGSRRYNFVGIEGGRERTAGSGEGTEAGEGRSRGWRGRKLRTQGKFRTEIHREQSARPAVGRRPSAGTWIERRSDHKRSPIHLAFVIRAPLDPCRA